MGNLTAPYRGFTRQRTTIEMEHYTPKGGIGPAITIRYAGKLTPEAIGNWRPMARMTAILANHIRHRIRDRQLGADGAKMGPGKISGGMWDGLAVSVTAKGRVRMYFRGSSVSYMRKSSGMIARLDSTGRPLKVKNDLKARNVSGFGLVPPRDKDGRFIFETSSKANTRKYGTATIPVGFEPPRNKKGRFKRWTAKMRSKSEGIMRRVRQQYASGKHRPNHLLEPSPAEFSAVISVLGLGYKGLGMSGGSVSSEKLAGDPRLIRALRRGLGV